MKVVSRLCLLMVLTACSDGSERPPAPRFAVDHEPFPLTEALALPVFANESVDDSLQRRLALFVVFDELTCTACLNTSLDYVAAMHDDLGDRLGFIAVARGAGFSSLRNLRRIGRVRYPILEAETESLTDLPEVFHMALVDLREERVVLRFAPTTESLVHLPAFEHAVMEILQEQERGQSR